MSLAAILLFPESGGDSPPLASLALVGGVIAAVTTAALSMIMRRELRLPARVTVSFAIAFALIAVVKFVLAPRGLYEVNAIRALDATVGSVADSGGAALTAVAIFGLYALAYWGLFWLGYGDQLPRRRRRGVRSERRIPTAVGCLLIAVGIVLGAALLFLGMLRRLWRTPDRREEQLAIGLGAKMGNGLLACTLAWLVLDAEGAPVAVRVVALSFLTLVFAWVFVLLDARRDDIEIAYKG